MHSTGRPSSSADTLAMVVTWLAKQEWLATPWPNPGAILRGRETPAAEDVRAVAPAVFRHRIVTNFNAEADGVGVEGILDDLIENVAPPK